MKKPLTEVVIDGVTREPNPRARRPDGSIIVACKGGPYDGKEVRLYSPFDDPIVVPNGTYHLSLSPRKGGKDILVFERKEP